MPIDIRRSTRPSVWIGICLVLAGIGLTLESMHLIQPGQVLQYWPVGLVLIGIGLVADAFASPRTEAESTERRSNPLVILGILCAFLLLSQAFQHRARSPEDTSDASVRVYSVLGGSTAVSRSPKFPGGEMTSFMGGSVLDLRQATIPPGEEASVELTVVMGGAEIRVPPGWTVDTRAVAVLGGIDDQRRRGAVQKDEIQAEANAPKPPRLIVRGDIVMGGLVIKY